MIMTSPASDWDEIFVNETMSAKKTVTSAFAAADCPPFYFGGETGAICFGDDMGHSNDAVAPLGAPLGATRCEANTAGVVRPGLPPQPSPTPDHLGGRCPALPCGE